MLDLKLILNVKTDDNDYTKNIGILYIKSNLVILIRIYGYKMSSRFFSTF